MFSKLLLTIFCALLPANSNCASAPVPLSVPKTTQTTPIPLSETFTQLTNLTTSKGKNTFKILVSSPLGSDGLQLHLKLAPPLMISPTLTKSTVPSLNILTAQVLGSEIWLAGITQNPIRPWVSLLPQEIGQFTINTPNPSSITVLIGSTSNVLQHQTGTNLLDNDQALVTIEK